MITTDRDIRDQVQQAIEGSDGSYDVEGITRTLIDRYDVLGDSPADTIDTIEHDAFWAIVLDHATD